VKLALVIVAVAMPEPVMVTCAVAVVVDAATGEYCTMIVQLPPGPTTAPMTQVPPALMAKAPPAPPTFATVGVAVRVRGPVAAAALLTVIVPVSTAVLAGVGASVGEGAEMAAVAPVTVNGSVLLAPIVVVTPILWAAPRAAPGVMFKVAVTVVELTATKLLTVMPPVAVTAVAPARLAPVMVIGTALPRTPVFGAIEFSVAP